MIRPHKTRSDAWYAPLNHRQRIDILKNLKGLNWASALVEIGARYGIKKISRTAYFSGLKRMEEDELRLHQIIAAETPPALVEMNKINKSLEEIKLKLDDVCSLLKQSQIKQSQKVEHLKRVGQCVFGG